MDETQEQQGQEATDTLNRGDNQKPLDKVERAERAVQRLEEIEKRIDEKTAKLQELQAERIVSGNSYGSTQEQKKEIDPRSYAEQALKNRIPQ